MEQIFRLRMMVQAVHFCRRTCTSRICLHLFRLPSFILFSALINYFKIENLCIFSLNV